MGSRSRICHRARPCHESDGRARDPAPEARHRSASSSSSPAATPPESPPPTTAKSRAPASSPAAPRRSPAPTAGRPGRRPGVRPRGRRRAHPSSARTATRARPPGWCRRPAASASPSPATSATSPPLPPVVDHGALPVWPTRRARQQRRLPGPAGEHRGSHQRAIQARPPHQRLPHVLPVQGRRPAHEAGLSAIINTASIQAFDPSPTLLPTPRPRCIVGFTKGACPGR